MNACQQHTTALENELSAQVGPLEASLAECKDKVASLQERLAASERDYEQRLLDAQVAAIPAAATRSGGIDLDVQLGVTAKEIDDFTQIKGIGPAFAARLAEAGIASYADLQTADPNELSNALGIKEWQKVDIAAWQQQAQTLASATT